MKIKKTMIESMAEELKAAGVPNPQSTAEVEFEKKQRHSIRKAYSRNMFDQLNGRSDSNSKEAHEDRFKSKLLQEIACRNTYQHTHKKLCRETIIEMLRVHPEEVNTHLIEKIVDRFLELYEAGNDAIDTRRIATFSDAFSEEHRNWKIRNNKGQGIGGSFSLVILDNATYIFDDTRQIKYIVTQ